MRDRLQGLDKNSAAHLNKRVTYRLQSRKTHYLGGGSETHNPKVVGSNPTPATKNRRAPEKSGALFAYKKLYWAYVFRDSVNQGLL
jgi:hypothetical protein